MTSTAGRRLRGRAAGKRGGKKKSRATAKRRARALVRASRPKSKPKRTPKARSRARRTAVAKRTVPARPAARRARPRLKAVTGRKRRLARAAITPAFPQTAGAPARQQLMFRMVKARASVLAAVQGMSASAADRPLGEGKWTVRETLLHLVTRDRARLREMEAALRGIRPSWDGLDPVGQARVNEEDLEPLRAVSWEDALKLLLTTRQDLMEALESVPEEPSDVWSEDHPLGWMFQRLPGHDLHHADIIKRWRTEQGA